MENIFINSFFLLIFLNFPQTKFYLYHTLHHGNVSSTELPTGSGKGMRAYCCVICGVYVYCQYNISSGKGGRIAVRTATLENPITPDAHIFVKDKDPWIDIVNKNICHDEMYDRDKTWSGESLKRLKEKMN